MQLEANETSGLTRSGRDANGKERAEMICPKCEEWQDILAFKNFQLVAAYASRLNHIMKCQKCRHTFSPRWTNED